MSDKNIVLGVFLGIGESFIDYKSKGQYDLITNQLLKNYSQNFRQVYVFSYAREKFTLFDNIQVLPNKWHLHRYIYAFTLPLFYPQIISSCNVFRGLQITGGLPGILTKILWNKKIVVNYGYDYQQMAQIEGKLWQAWFYKLTTNLIINIVDKVIVTAKYLKKSVLKKKSWGKLVIIPNGVNVSLFKPRSLKKGQSVLYIGRLEKQKNLQNLTQAFACLKKYKLKLRFIGSGSKKYQLLRLAKKHQVDLIISKPIAHNKLPDQLNRALLFILPSYIEGQPKVLLEAMACGLPVIASDIAAHQEIIQHKKNGLLCSTNVKGITKGIETLLEDERLRKRIAEMARKTTVEQYNINRLNQREIKLLYQTAYESK